MIWKLRKQVFWILDFIKGSHVRQAYNELKRSEMLDSDDNIIKSSCNQSLSNLLNHVTVNTPFYLKYKGQSFFEYPIINKNIIRENEEEFISSNFIDKKLVMMSTSGSTGTPFKVYQDLRKKKRVKAELIYYNEKLGYQVGKKVIFLRSLNKANIKSKIVQFLQNLKLIDVANMDNDNVKKIIKLIEKAAKKDGLLMSYASTFDIFKDYFKKVNDKHSIKITGIISGSEMLYDETRKSMEEHFNCKCVSRYSNQENGIIGQDSTHNNVFICNDINYKIEIFKLNEDVIVENGEIGRIVITDFYNFAMPMIRYDTGDVGSIDTIIINGVKKKVIKNFGGRKIDMIYSTKGTIVSPHKISVTFWNYDNIQQFQFIQKGKNKYHVILNVQGFFNNENQLKQKLMEIIGFDARIHFTYVESIPALSSGKRKYIINDWEQT